MSRLSRILPIVGGAVAGGAIALAVASGSTTTHSVTTTVVQSPGASSVPTSVSANRGLSVNQIYRQASPGVVDILVTSQSSGGAGGLFGGSQQTQGEGAGVVYDKQGDILTDEHVVANATSVTVKLMNGKTAPAKVVGTDPSTDIAVIHVDLPASELHPIPLADSSAAQVGDSVVAMGSPFGLPGTVTTGIVSATGRSIQAPNQYTITGRSRRTRRSTTATPAVRCSIRPDTCSASTTRSRRTPAPTPASASRSLRTRRGASPSRSSGAAAAP